MEEGVGIRTATRARIGDDNGMVQRVVEQHECATAVFLDGGTQG